MNRFLLVCIFAGALQSGATASELNRFSSDGCSLFPDGTPNDRSRWCDCCFDHDLAYWRGGSREERKAADRALRSCVMERTKNQALAETMYTGVRLGGSPVFPTWYRWGYGWKYGRGYRKLKAEESRQVDEKLASYTKNHPSGYCRKP